MNSFRHPLWKRLSNFVADLSHRVDNKSLALQVSLAVVALALATIWFNLYSDFQQEFAQISEEIAENKAAERDLPPRTPWIALATGAFIVGIAFLNSLRLRSRLSALRRSRVTQWSLWIAAAGILIGWLPADFAANQATLFGRGFVGEEPSQIAYIGKLVLLGLMILSLPLTSWLYFRSSLMDQYVVRTFLTPFSFCLIGFVGIWLIADFTDNATDLAGANFGRVLKFYVIQLPYMILFVMPVTLLLSLLYSLSRMSKANEIVSMLGAGRSMMRILRPLFFAGVYCSLICLVFKYEWAPRSEGYKTNVLSEIKSEQLLKQSNRTTKLESPWQRTGWLHVNEVDRRTWFVGRVPYDLQSKSMASISIWQFDADSKLLVNFRATSAKWFFSTREWRLSNGKTYFYQKDGIPRIQSWDFLDIPGWRETPWKVLSSAQNPDHLGITGLTTYLKNNADYDSRVLAPFKTAWWYCWAEPLSCLVMVLIAAPLGIVYSRRGVLGGVAASIAIFALMYFLSGTLTAMGKGRYLNPFVAAWATNIIFGCVGAGLLFYRAKNREVPTFKSLMSRYRARRILKSTGSAPAAS